ncbi:hypothetical protein [Pseudonocardia sp. KRD291]|uniref:hypothetical protein n=1 Tax=Pseudonocardia sp. KRD291 TaxID=2792007 RepID=UPI001C4A1EB0|nr:hypothetical protein [Pseudonocardia sp. KRD291]MBW0105167.1 hypothetical protein [Pseudonocardia sp. KRD291]MDN5913945.1 hypothetical protein [Pseudonocardia sp.]
MSLTLSPGVRLRSAVCPTEVVVLRAGGPADLRCGGAPMVGKDEPVGSAGPVPPFDGGVQVGKRYVHPGQGVEVLCTKAGPGSLSVGEEPLELKSAAPLPSSD